MFGDYDWMYHPDVPEGLKTLRTPCDLRIITHAGHHLYLDNPSDFHQQLLNVMKREQRL